MEPHIRDSIQSVRECLDVAGESVDVDAADVLIAVRLLTKVVERLYNRILDLEKVQNERGEQ